ncbi:hypothetical protein CUMW_273560 [Citrus unshiu]|uniref:Transcription initiation factor TFIID subunit 1 histone acetyltransferase domain-containing protein n=1 Tax=Citrus unshiu TaxID=55188 RepID=A0A2H5MX38_CITUN|nr:hypothetical protein CUMW_273560 [Citrus unshiu]
MKECAFLRRDGNGKQVWSMKRTFHIPSEGDLRKLVYPEHNHLRYPTNLLPDEAIALAAASHIERELQITPWNLSSNFVACTNQDRENIERLEITGVGDPSGRGLGFSYVRAAPKASVSSAMVKKKVAANRGGSTVTGTDADLRRLSMEAAREELLIPKPKLIDDEAELKKKKKKTKAQVEGGLSLAKSISGLEIVERLKKANKPAKHIAITVQPNGSHTANEQIKDPKEEESLIAKRNLSGKVQAMKKNSISPVGKKVKIVHGHMRTNKNCPRYRADPETQLETADMDKSLGKSNSLDPSSQSQLKSLKKKKLISKSATKML